MFTGLIQGLGTIRPQGSDRFIISLKDGKTTDIWTDLALGDSVAINGICLTVEEITSDGFIATASPETLQRTTLGQQVQTTGYANVELSLRVGGKLGGHFVTGHVDGVGYFVEAISTEKAWDMFFSAPPSLLEQWQENIERYLFPKGSVAVNGISLTIAEYDPREHWFKVAVIPHTYHQTNLSYLTIGDWVNIEGDILGKHVAKLLGQSSNLYQASQDVSLGFLSEHGYI
ncbi:riboflavin synthase subunit alpha [cyanobacterium endosymbiont of Rhopalodia gibberula]|uniref:riboflavin synthase n=1 Tax=cyanobacterium endosymbiont of Rhopalodia gibberula TaxID=1763363 RepID=UPI000DC7262A|nr:riboflavin synthase [cyanobacterium endosymbiont of Rhopalodia gibberula]BBA78809.1 riboflavin synthase subunit alpha [cyanobacterium endosymbiont of Rhopalodia gibberula]